MKTSIVTLSLCANIHCATLIPGTGTTNTVPNRYIVVYNNSTTDEVFNAHVTQQKATKNLEQNTVFNFGGLKGYTVKSSSEAITQLAESDDIAYIEPDHTISLPHSIPQAPLRPQKRNFQPNAPWNLARISHRAHGSTDYIFTPSTGTAIYVLDTGIRITHQAFSGRATHGFNAVGGSNDDINGHGTHVAGIVASLTYGVVRFADIVSVKVLDDSGSATISQIISGISWAVHDSQSKNRRNNSTTYATAVLAAGGSFSTALNAAIASAASAGLLFAVPAGSENTNAGSNSPASEPTACTVGATTMSDAKMSSSNWGAVVDIWAPGERILSSWITSHTSTMYLSGGSAAAAHIAGLGAYFLALEGPRGAVALCERLKEVATRNVLSGIPAGTANLLAYNLSGL
ncbi:protease [Byssothecium circinans]|uniref:Protease n=1 Tax=Byssothecium circinans TaxID=147558 RepID=A0A6A5TTS0_9PLEO|nr:protease [Byssothecium circinans]